MESKCLKQLMPLTYQFMVARSSGQEDLAKKIAKETFLYAASRETRIEIIDDSYEYAKDNLISADITSVALKRAKKPFPLQAIEIAKKYGGDVKKIEREVVSTLIQTTSIENLSGLELSLTSEEIKEISNNILDTYVNKKGKNYYETHKYASKSLQIAKYLEDEEKIRLTSKKLFELNLICNENIENKENAELIERLDKTTIEMITEYSIKEWLKLGDIHLAKKIAELYAPNFVSGIEKINVGIKNYPY